MSRHVLIRMLPAVVAAVLALTPTSAVAHGDEDPDLKNAVSRGPVAAGATDPTTKAQAMTSADAVAAQRAEPDPTLVPTSSAEYRAHADVPQDKYAMAGGCYALQSPENSK